MDARDTLLTGILPFDATFTLITCWVLGDTISQLVFGAEREMARLLEVKAATGGLNTVHFEKHNCHVLAIPLVVPRDLAGCAVIAEDRRSPVSASGMSVSVLDGNQSLNAVERFKHMDVVQQLAGAHDPLRVYEVSPR